MSTQYQSFGLDEWLEHIQNQHWRTMDMTLERVSQVWKNLNGQITGFTIVVAGTNGKGSCVSLLDGVFQEMGKCAGTFTSPHLVRFNERIRINGEESTDDDICCAFREIEDARGTIPLTYFEYGTLAALLVFQQKSVEVAILEVGMGGRLDAVNMVSNDLVLITSIGVDHEQWLGTDREKIAAEKAGVIKLQGLVVCADPNIPASVVNIAIQQEAVLISAGREYFIEEGKSGIFWKSNHAAIPKDWCSIGPLLPRFSGHHQIMNMGGVVAALALSSHQTGVTVEHLQNGFNRAQLSARCQVISDNSGRNPEIIIDVAHNEDSAIELANFLDTRDHQGETYAVFGVLEDKALNKIVEPIQHKVNHWMLASLMVERGQTSLQLGDKLSKVIKNVKWTSFESPIDAYLESMQLAKPQDRVVIFGSFHTVGDIIGHIEQVK